MSPEKRTGKFLFYGMAVLFIIFLSTHGFAQNIAVEDSSSGGNGSDVFTRDRDTTYDIVVTAPKRKRQLQDVPASITVLDAHTIRDRNISDTRDIDSYVPYMETHSYAENFSYYSLRGQTNFNTYSNPIGIYVDDAPIISDGFWTDMPLWGIQQIEVLRGPQGNLYGLNSSGGIVNIRTRQPDNYWIVSADVMYGNYNSFEGKGIVSGPVLEDTLYVGVSGLYRRSDSFIEEKGNDDRNQWLGGGRIQVRCTPSDRLDITLTAQSSHLDSNYIFFTIEDDDPFEVDSHNYDEYYRTTAHTQSLRVQYTFGSFEILSVSNLTSGMMDSDIETFSNGLNHYAISYDTRIFTEELRFVSNRRRSPFQWLAGIFYRNTRQEYNATYTTSGIPLTPADTDVVERSIAVFAEVSYTFFRRLTLTAGVRYDYDRKEFDQESIYGTLDDSNDWDFVSPKLAIDYRITENVRVYGSAAKSCMAGGYALVESNNIENNRFDQEHIISFETGAKTTWLNGRLMANAAGFYNAIDDMQLYYLDLATYTRYYSNAARATVYGFEVELAARPCGGLEIGVPVGWIHARIDEDDEEVDLKGNTVPLTPEYTVGCFAQYTHVTGVFVRGEFNRLGRTYFDKENNSIQDAYTVINMKAGYRREHVTIAMYSNNLLDKEYFTYKTEAGGLAIVGAPRTFGFQASAEF